MTSKGIMSIKHRIDANGTGQLTAATQRQLLDLVPDDATITSHQNDSQRDGASWSWSAQWTNEQDLEWRAAAAITATLENVTPGWYPDGFDALADPFMADNATPRCQSVSNEKDAQFGYAVGSQCSRASGHSTLRNKVGHSYLRQSTIDRRAARDS